MRQKIFHSKDLSSNTAISQTSYESLYLGNTHTNHLVSNSFISYSCLCFRMYMNLNISTLKIQYLLIQILLLDFKQISQQGDAGNVHFRDKQLSYNSLQILHTVLGTFEIIYLLVNRLQQIVKKTVQHCLYEIFL